MKNLTLLILETDADYGSRLADYLGSRADSPFLIRLFLSHPCPADTLSQSDALLVTSSLWPQYRDLLPSCPVLVLDESSCPAEDAQTAVYKYQSAARIYEALQRCFLEQSGRPMTRDAMLTRHVRFISVYTPSSDPQIASALFSALREESSGHAVLYLNMEPVPSRGPLLAGSGEGLSALIYYMKQYPDTIGARLSMMTGHDGFDYLAPADYSGELLELDASDWMHLAEGLRRDTPYEQVYLDFGGALPPQDLIPLCDEVRILRSSASWEGDLADRFCELLAHAAGPEISDKIHVQICR